MRASGIVSAKASVKSPEPRRPQQQEYKDAAGIRHAADAEMRSHGRRQLTAQPQHEESPETRASDEEDSRHDVLSGGAAFESMAHPCHSRERLSLARRAIEISHKKASPAGMAYEKASDTPEPISSVEESFATLTSAKTMR
jgi:hypothetical protein